MKMKQKQERKSKIEKDNLKTPDDSLEKQDSIEKIPLPDIPGEGANRKEETESVEDKEEDNVGKVTVAEETSVGAAIIFEDTRDKESEKSAMETHIPTKPKTIGEKPKVPAKPKSLEKPSIPEKTKRILEKIESKFSEVNKNSSTKISRPKIIDTGFDDFVEPVAELPLDEVPVKPALELDSLKVPEFVPFMLRPHAEPLRSKSLSLAEEKAPIDTLLSPEVENKHFVQDISPKRAKKFKSETKKDFKKQSKSLEGDKPPLKKSSSKESKTSANATKIDKSKLKLGEMPQEIIIIDSTDIAPEVSIIQKGRSKSVTRLSDKPFSTSKEEKDDTKGTRAKSASIDDDLIKGHGGVKSEKVRPKSLGISKSLGSAEKKDFVEKVSPKKTISKNVVKSDTRTDIPKSNTSKDVTVKPSRPKADTKSDSDTELMGESKPEKDATKSKEKKDVEPESKIVQSNQSVDTKRSSVSDTSKDVKKLPFVQELTESPIVLRKPGQTPILFARARLGLSEGSGIGALQRQGATQSPTAQRRAKSLDAPVISVHRLPPTNAFSSKDDTVDMSEDMENQEIIPEEETGANASKPQSMQIEASPNHRSDSTDHTTIPEIFTDSLSVTETSAQYLESPLTECNEIATCADLIPYEHETAQLPFVEYMTDKETASAAVNAAKVDEDTRFIDQSSVESGIEQEVQQEDADSKVLSKLITKSISSEIASSVEMQQAETFHESVSSTEEINDVNRQEYITDTIDARFESYRQTEDDHRKTSIERDDVPNVTVSMVKDGNYPVLSDYDETPEMVKSPIQISIEECSDEEIVYSEEQEEEEDVEDRESVQADGDDNRPLDSADTSEDTLDALDTQVQMRGADSELSSPDYGIDKMDEKTLVEVELTPEYLEMRKEEEEGAEELPEDEPNKETSKETVDVNVSSYDKKLRLSAERSRSEDTSTWTPDREDPDSSSCSIARPLGIGEIQSIVDQREVSLIKEARNDGSIEEDSSGSHPVPKPELSSTWKPFPLESSGSSSLEEGWAPQDDNNAQQSHSEGSNGQNEDSCQEDLVDIPGSFIYPISPEIFANYGAFSLLRTLSRISERSTTSEQDKSDLEDSFKPSSRSPSLDDESLISSDHQPSLSSDPPSGTALPSVSDDRRTSAELPDIPIDVVGAQEEDSKSPRATRRSRLQLQSSEDWPSPPSSPPFDTPSVNHVETFYMEIKPEEAVKVTVTDSTETPGQMEHDSDSSDENRTLHDDLHSTLLEDAQSSTSATTVDGTVKIVVKPKSNSYITGSSHSEDTSMGLSMSEWSSSNNTVRQFCQYSGTKSDDNSLAELGASISDWSGSTTIIPQQYYSTITVEKSQSDTTTSDKSVTSMRPNSKCQSSESPPLPAPSPPPPPLPPPPAMSSDEIDERKKDHRLRDDLENIITDDDDDDDDDDDNNDVDEGDDEDPSSSIRTRRDEFDEARKFIENQFQQRLQQYDEEQQGSHSGFTYVSPLRIIFQNKYEEMIDDDFQINPEVMDMNVTDLPVPIPEEDEDDQLYDNVPAMKYSSGEQIRMEVSRGDSSEDMHEKYADLALRTRLADDDWSFEEQQKDAAEDERATRNKFERGYSEPGYHQEGEGKRQQHGGTRSTERPVVVPIKAKSTPYYSTTSLSGESTTSSPPMQIRTQIRTKTMPYLSSRSPQSEGDTSSSMDSPGHTPDRGQRAFRRKRQQNAKRRHRVAVDLEVKDGQIVSSTDSSFDVGTIPPPLLTEGQNIDANDDEDDELSEIKND